MKKKIIFFDGDGTLWYPKKTKYTKHPVWLYRDKRFKNHVNHLIMIPSVLSTLRKLRRMGIITIVLSTHPQPPEEADAIINHKIKHFRLNELSDEVHATREHQESKGEFIIEILKRRKIPKSKALMVGDSYRWDFEPAKNSGVDALLIESEYESLKHKAKRTIKKLSDIFNYVS
jgi:phosphoglycolate phosphatase-like HAD superfamily hydrolase|tara:strand:+ start:339 stop:860 length:522 start_codon:yes stop_codon:yes gene_type:complete